ncbi:hypothetical protein PAMP_008287 [Pampus punctatissimus]
MAKKSLSRKSLKSLFSRSEPSLDESTEKDAHKNGGEKKRFKFLKFKMKSKGEKSANENQQVHSAVDPNNTAENRDAGAENIISDKKRTSLYATAPRSHICRFSLNPHILERKEFSYSESDLRKPKRFATISFGLRKKKRKDEENISKSAVGLHSMDIEEQDENHLDLSQMELDQANTKTMFSMSQPELDTSDAFDIPTPPPVATNQSEYNFPLPNQTQSSVTINTQPEYQKPLINGSDFHDVLQDTWKAPIATIPELELDDPGLSEENENIPVHDNSSKTVSNSSASMTRTIDIQTAPSVPASHPAVMLQTSDHKAAVVDSVCARKSLCDSDIPQQSNTKTEISLTESASVTLSQHQPDKSDTADSLTPSGEASLAYVDSTNTESAPGPHTDNSAIPETVGSVTTASSVSGEKCAPPVNEDTVYPALYDSLFPEGFTSEIMSSLSTSSFQICTEIIRHVNIKTPNECNTESNVTYNLPLASHNSAARTTNDAVGGYTNINFSEMHPSSVNSHSELVGQDTDRIPFSELTPSLSDSPNLVEDTVRSVAQSSAPPVSQCVTSQGTDAQVTDSIRREIIVKELVTNGTSADSGSLAPVPDKMTAVKGLNMKIDTTEKEDCSVPARLMEGYEVPCSPAYLSVGSDDGSTMEFYYSAEEDNVEESGGEEMYTVDKREETCVVDGLKDVIPKQEEITVMEHEGGKIGNEEKHLESQIETQQLLKGQRAEAQVQETGMSEFLVGSDGRSKETEIAGKVLPRIKEEGEERKEELLATPVQQVNTLMVCEPHGQGEGSEGNWTTNLETHEQPSLAFKDIRSSECVLASFNNTREEGTITPNGRDADERVSLTTEGKGREESKEGADATKSAVTDTSVVAEVVKDTLTRCVELQSDATENEHNRAVQCSELVDTITQSTDRNGTVLEQVAIKPSDLNTHTHHPGSKTAAVLSERQEQTHQIHADLNQGSPTAASESQQTKVDDMNSGFSRLSTSLFIKNSTLPKEDDSKNRFHKVSLVDEADITEFNHNIVDFSKKSTTVTESNEPDLGSEHKWRNTFEGVFQHELYKPEDSSSSDTLSYKMPDTSSFSSSSAVPEAIAYKQDNNVFSTSSPSPSPPSTEEHITIGNRLSDRTEVYLRREQAGEPKGEQRRGFVEKEESAAPAGETEGEAEPKPEKIESSWDSQQLPVSGFSSVHLTSCDTTDSFKEKDNSSNFTGVFKAMRVELVSDPSGPFSTPPDMDTSSTHEMENLVDTLKSMGPAMRPRSLGLRGPPQGHQSSLPPIVEDGPSPVTSNPHTSHTSLTNDKGAKGTPDGSLNGPYILPVDLGLKRHTVRDTRSPVELLKQNQQQEQQQSGTRGMNLPLRVSATNSIVMRKSSDSSPEDLKSTVPNGNGIPSPGTGSRLDHSSLFGNYRSASTDQIQENGTSPRLLFLNSSLPDIGFSNDRMSVGRNELCKPITGTDAAASRFDRFSFLLNSSSTSGSMNGAEDSSRISRPPALGSISPSSNQSSTNSIDFHRPFTTTDSPLSMFGQTQGKGMSVGTGPMSSPILQRSFSNEGTMGIQQPLLFNNMHGGAQQQSQEESEKSLLSKYRAFPDAYLTKEKEHGKLNPRPGKIYIFDQTGMCGQRIEVRSDVVDATSWELQETISIRVVRGGWVLYEKPNFKGEKVALDEGDIELTCPFSSPEEHQDRQKGEQARDGSNGQTNTKPPKKFVIGSLRRAVRDYSVPDISLYPEENAEGKKVTFRDTSEDARIFGFPVKANSIVINAGLWLVFSQPFFQGVPRILEVGGYSNPAAWGVEQPYVGSLHPLKVGEPRVENVEPKIVIYEKAYFTGKSRTITTNTKDFMTRTDRQQTAFMYNVGSLKVLGGIWVGYEKESFRGNQYLLEEGEYHDWRAWGGCDAELRSVRVIRADLTEPLMVMFEQLEEENDGTQEESTFEVTEAIPDVELFGYKTSTRSIHVLSGAWIAYSHVDFSGKQYILEKGFYNSCADWGSQESRICSVQPILLAPSDPGGRNEIILYPDTDFGGDCHIFPRNDEATSEKVLTKSCRVVGGSWIIYDERKYSGNMFVLPEGDYPNLISMGCPPGYTIRSVKAVPITFSVPSISLFGFECLEGREITTDTEIYNMLEEGFNNHILSVRVNSGSWVVFEHSNYRGRQFLLEPIEITNWPKFSLSETIGSLYPIRQKRHFFRIKNKERGHFMSVQGGVEEMKSGRVVVAAEVEPMSDIWFYHDGLIKNKMSSNMNLQVMGNVEPGAKLVLWTETRHPMQIWSAKMNGYISSLTFPGMVVDIKGGKTYDKDHVVIMPENDEMPSQQWEIELL